MAKQEQDPMPIGVIRSPGIEIPKPRKNIEAVVNEWFAAHFHNTEYAGITTLYNKLHEAKEDLIARLKEV